VSDVGERKADLTRRWRVSIERWLDTPTSHVGLGERKGDPVVLKVVKTQGDEWNAGAVVAAFNGRRVVRVFEHEPGAMLLERAMPGTSLVETVQTDRDGEAVDVLGAMITGMSADEIPNGCATAEQWGRAFARYQAAGHAQISPALIEAAESTYSDLCARQQTPRLLHGDLQHYNVLFDQTRGWLTIDPKGVVAEREFEVGPFLRNPRGMPWVYSTPRIVERRLTHLCRAAHLDFDRALRWAFAQAVLSAIWSVEDEGAVNPTDPALLLARAIQPLL